MNNPYLEYYREQAGSGLSGFQGVKFQRGHGFFGRILSKAIYPLMRFLGKTALSTGADIASDVINDDVNWKDSIKNRLKETGKNIANEGISKVRSFAQKGSGKKKRNSKSRKKPLKSKLIKKKKRTKKSIKSKTQNLF